MSDTTKSRLPVIEILTRAIMPGQGTKQDAVLQTLTITPEPVQLAYIAGFFDGEGTVHIRDANRFPTIHVNIGQAAREVLDWLQSVYGGNIYVYEPKPGRSITKDFHQWSIVGTRAAKFLHDIYPYVRIKKAAIDAAVERRYAA